MKVFLSTDFGYSKNSKIDTGVPSDKEGKPKRSFRIFLF